MEDLMIILSDSKINQEVWEISIASQVKIVVARS